MKKYVGLLPFWLKGVLPGALTKMNAHKVDLTKMNPPKVDLTKMNPPKVI